MAVNETMNKVINSYTIREPKLLSILVIYKGAELNGVVYIQVISKIRIVLHTNTIISADCSFGSYVI